MSWIFTIISLIFCCVAAFYLNKARKANAELSQEIFAREIEVNKLLTERDSRINDKVKSAVGNIVDDALRRTFNVINSPTDVGYVVTTSSDTPKTYAVWRKLNASNKYYDNCSFSYGMAYILVKMFDSDNAEENLKNATELCDKLNEKL